MEFNFDLISFLIGVIAALILGGGAFLLPILFDEF
jgi:hypothetical protein